MPYEKSPEQLRKLVEKVLQDPANSEISEGLKRSRIDEAALYRAIDKNANDIWAGVSSEIADYDATDSRLHLEAKLATMVDPEPDPNSARAGFASKVMEQLLSVFSVSLW